MRDSDVTIPQADAWAISGLVSDTLKCVVSVVTGPDAELGAFPLISSCKADLRLSAAGQRISDKMESTSEVIFNFMQIQSLYVLLASLSR